MLPTTDPFGLYADSLMQSVREVLPVEDLNDIFAPRVDDETASCFFPGFTACRIPDAHANIITRFRCLPKEWQEAWHSRLWLNSIGAIAEYDAELREILTKEGPVPTRVEAVQVLGTAISKNWIFGLWAYAVSKAAPKSTYLRIDLLVMECCFVLESVESRIADKPGGLRLVEEILHVLDSQGTNMNIPWIHTTATNPDAERMFRKHGFTDFQSADKLLSKRAVPLRRAVRPATRPLGAPPQDLKSQFPDP